VSEESVVQIRAAKKDDIQFITANWGHSYRDAPFVRGVPNSVYWFYHHKIMETLLPRSTVLIACNAEDPNQILAFLCAEMWDTCLVIHYIYVKKIYQKVGLATRLVNAMKESERPSHIQYTSKTQDIFPIERKMKERGMTYNPYLLYAALPPGWDE